MSHISAIFNFDFSMKTICPFQMLHFFKVLNKPKPLNRFSDVHAGLSLFTIFRHIIKHLVITRLSHWPLGGKTIASSLPKGLLTLKGRRIFFHLILGWRVISTIFAMHTRSPNHVLGLCILRIALSLTSSSC